MGWETDTPPTTNERYGEALETAQRLVRMMHSGMQPAQRDDLVQNVMQRLVQRFGCEGWPDNIDAYLRRSIRNTEINMADHQARRPVVPAGLDSFQDSGEVLDALVREIRLTPSVLAAQEIVVNRALDLLDERQAQLFRMRFIDNVPTGMIAEDLGLHPDTVSRLCHRAKRDLAAALAEHPKVLSELQLVISR